MKERGGKLSFFLFFFSFLSFAFSFQVRLSFGKDPRKEMHLLWHSKEEIREALVQYGIASPLEREEKGRKVPCMYSQSVIYEAFLKNLFPDTTYFYRVRTSEGWSSLYTFHTAPSAQKPFTFTAWGDQGISQASKKNVWLALQEAPSFHLHLGDIAYAGGSSAIWDRWGAITTPLSSLVPYMPVLGNHEYERRGGKPLSVSSYLARFSLPDEETWYSFDYSGVRFIAFNSNFLSQKQLQWLKKELSQALEKKLSWTIVFQHHPLYSSVRGRGNNPALILAQRPLFDTYRVDLVLAGHQHVYERSYPLRENRVKSRELRAYKKGEGTIYVTSGGGGAPLYAFLPEMPEITAFRVSAHHFLKVRVTPSSLFVEAVGQREGKREVLDWFEIKESF